MHKVELYGASHCPYTRELREWLEFRGVEFVEYDIDADDSARDRLSLAVHGARMIPVLIEDGSISQVGWQGRGCVFGAQPTR